MLTPCYTVTQKRGDLRQLIVTDHTGSYNVVTNPGGWWPEPSAGTAIDPLRVAPTRSESIVTLTIYHTLSGSIIGTYSLLDRRENEPGFVYQIPFGHDDGVYTFDISVQSFAGQPVKLYSYNLTLLETGDPLWLLKGGALVLSQSEVTIVNGRRTWAMQLIPDVITEWKEINLQGQITRSGTMSPTFTANSSTVSFIGTERKLVASRKFNQIVSSQTQCFLADSAMEITASYCQPQSLDRHRLSAAMRWTMADSGLMALEAALSRLSIFTSEKEINRIKQLAASIRLTTQW